MPNDRRQFPDAGTAGHSKNRTGNMQIQSAEKSQAHGSAKKGQTRFDDDKHDEGYDDEDSRRVVSDERCALCNIVLPKQQPRGSQICMLTSW